MSSILELLPAPQVVGVLAALGLSFLLIRLVYSEYTSPLRYYPGPPNTNLIWGNMKEIMAAENSVLHEKWTEEYGPTLKYRVFFGMKRLYTTDTKALNHILMNHYIYQKPEQARYGLSRVLGSGILVAEEDKHKIQRRIMNPAFGSSQVRELTEIFVEKSIQLRDLWASQASTDGGVARVDVLSWLSRTTLDVIGLAGFNYKFDALNPSGEPNELNKAFSEIFGTINHINIWNLIQSFVPPLRFLPSERRDTTGNARKTMSRIGKELLRDSKASLIATGEKADNWNARDLLSLLVRSNLSTELPESQRMSDDDVVSQVPTFLVAGHETTSTATTWALYALALDKAIQTKLREELLTVSTDTPTMDQLNSLPYLDAVVRETLRIHTPVPSSVRVAVKDDVIPLGTPFTDTNGVVHETIEIRKGQTVFIPILALNRSKTLWGEDSMEFKPERWEKVPEAVSAIPGVWGNMLTFLGGARSCIGYKFSIVETKALLFVLIRAFEFDLAVAKEEIIKKASFVQRPRVKSEPDAGSQLPMLVKPYQL